MGGDHGDADAGDRDRELRQAEHLAGLLPQPGLLRGPAVLQERARPRHDVERDRLRERAGALPHHTAHIAGVRAQLRTGDEGELLAQRLDAAAAAPLTA